MAPKLLRALIAILAALIWLSAEQAGASPQIKSFAVEQPTSSLPSIEAEK